VFAKAHWLAVENSVAVFAILAPRNPTKIPPAIS
jgi:hypothetical protein